MSSSDLSVLVLEDDRIFNATLCDFFKDCGYQIVTGVFDVKSAFNALDNNQYDVVILDLHLVGNYGVTFLPLIQNRDVKPLIIVVSGVATESQLMDCYKQGADFILQKPFRLDELHKLISKSQNLNKADACFSLKHNVEGWIELTADSYFGLLERIKNITQILQASNIDNDIQQDITMAIDEIGRNAIEWGNNNNCNKKISLSYALFANEIVFKIEDEGLGFETMCDSDDDLLTKLLKRKQEGKRPGGFGIQMVKQVMDKVVYNKRGNIVLISKTL